MGPNMDITEKGANMGVTCEKHGDKHLEVPTQIRLYPRCGKCGRQPTGLWHLVRAVTPDVTIYLPAPDSVLEKRLQEGVGIVGRPLGDDTAWVSWHNGRHFYTAGWLLHPRREWERAVRAAMSEYVLCGGSLPSDEAHRGYDTVDLGELVPIGTYSMATDEISVTAPAVLAAALGFGDEL